MNQNNGSTPLAMTAGLFDAPLALAHLAGVPAPTLELLVALCKARARTAGLYT